MRAALYVRRSTKDHQLGSLDVQKTEGARYIEEQGWSLDPSLVFVDDGVSRAEFVNRPGLRAMQKVAAAKGFDVVVMRDETRLGGDSLRVPILISDLMDCGVRVFYYFENIEAKMTTPEQRMVVMVKSIAAEMEREKTAGRTFEHLEGKARRGLNAGGRVFGYDNHEVRESDGTRKHVEYRVSPAQSPIVIDIFKARAADRGFRDIAKDLNQRGVPSPRAGKRGTGSWSPSAVRGILRNERYRGTSIWGRSQKGYSRGTKIRGRRSKEELITFRSEDLRIVDEALWLLVQATMKPNADKPWRQTTGPKSKHLLSGLAECSECHGSIQVKQANHGSEQTKFYICGWHNDRGTSVCSNKLRRPVAEVDAAVIEWIQSNVLNEERIAEIFQEVRRRIAERLKTSNVDLPRLEAEARELREQLARLTEAVAMGAGEVASLVTSLKDRQDRLAALVARIAQSKAAPSRMLTEVKRLEKAAKDRLANLKTLFERNPQEARRLMEALLKGKLTFTPTKRPAGNRYLVEGKLTLGGVLSTAPSESVPYCERPQGDSNPC
jgi:site-specific DNA recombinase